MYKSVKLKYSLTCFPETFYFIRMMPYMYIKNGRRIFVRNVVLQNELRIIKYIMYTENHQLDFTDKSSGSARYNVMSTHLYKYIPYVHSGNQPPGTMTVTGDYNFLRITYNFKDGVQQVCLIIDMFYTLIILTVFTCMLFINGNQFTSLISYFLQTVLLR